MLAVAALIPRIVLPADVSLSVDASTCAGDETAFAITGALGPAPIRANLTADLDAEHVFGTLSTGEVDLAALTHGALVATTTARATLDVTAGRAGELPTATVHVDGHGTFRDLPRSAFSIGIDSRGQHVVTTIDVTGAAKATIKADLQRVADAIDLQHASIVASIPDAGYVTGGKARGALDVALTAHGRLVPAPDVAVAGTIKGRQLRVDNVSIGTLDATLDTRQLPAAPHGRARVRLTEVTRGTTQLGNVLIDAADRPASKIEVTVASRSKDVVADLTALVTPPTRADPTIVVDVVRDHASVRRHVEWTGSSGHLVVARDRIELSDLRTRSREGTIAIAGTYVRAGEQAGDLTAKLDIDQFTLDAISKAYLGTFGAHANVARRGGRWTGEIDAHAKRIGLVVAFAPPTLRQADVDLHVALRQTEISVAATVSDSKLGKVDLALDLAPPAKLEDPDAWKQRGRDVIRTAKLRLDGVDLGQIASATARETPAVAAAHPQDAAITGRLDGTLELTATTAKGSIKLHELHAPQLRGIRTVDADLELAQSGPDIVTTTLALDVAEVGKANARAELAIPHHVLDPAAWRQLGTNVVRSASIRTDAIAIDPALLDRFDITSTLHGRAKLAVDLEPTGSLKLAIRADELRGTPIAKPVAIRVDATIDGTAAVGSATMSSHVGQATLIELDARVPVTLAQLRARPRRVMTLPLQGTLELPKAPAAELLEVFGRTEVTRGTIDGKVTLGGTIGKPTLAAHLVGEGIGVPPGPSGKVIKTVNRLVLDAAWNQHGGKLMVEGSEDGGGKLALVAEGSPTDLAAATAKLDATAFDLTPLFPFAPGPAGGARGTLDANLTIKGFDPRTAKLAGDLRMRAARVPIAPTVGTLRDADISIGIHAHDIAIAATGKLGSGDVKLQGTVALDGVSLTGGQAKLTLRKVSPIGAVEPTIDADVTAKIARRNQTWVADVTVDNGFAKVSTKSAEKLKPVSMPSDLHIGRNTRRAAPKPGAPAPPAQPVLVANITLNAMNVESDEFRTTLQGKVTITADASALGIVGQVAAETGDLDLFGTRYRIERAAVNFDGTVDPQLDIQVSHDFTDLTTTTVVRGRLSKPELALSSNPGGYSQSELLGFLLGGEPAGAPTSGSARDKTTDAGTSLIANQLGGYVRKALPFDIDVIRYEAASVSSSAAVTVGSWVTHTLFFAFREHLDARPDENSGEASVEYWFTHRLELEGTAGDRGYDTLDMLWRKRF